MSAHVPCCLESWLVLRAELTPVEQSVAVNAKLPVADTPKRRLGMCNIRDCYREWRGGGEICATFLDTGQYSNAMFSAAMIVSPPDQCRYMINNTFRFLGASQLVA